MDVGGGALVKVRLLGGGASEFRRRACSDDGECNIVNLGNLRVIVCQEYVDFNSGGRPLDPRSPQYGSWMNTQGARVGLLCAEQGRGDEQSLKEEVAHVQRYQGYFLWLCSSQRPCDDFFVGEEALKGWSDQQEDPQIVLRECAEAYIASLKVDNVATAPQPDDVVDAAPPPSKGFKGALMGMFGGKK